MLLGIRTVIYPAPDLAAARDWFTSALGVAPYFDEPFYVGFSVGGCELGLDPSSAVDAGPIAYWGVDAIEPALAELAASGATDASDINDVGEGIRMATVVLPNGCGTFGLIENPNFALAPAASPGPGL